VRSAIKGLNSAQSEAEWRSLEDRLQSLGSTKTNSAASTAKLYDAHNVLIRDVKY